MTGTCPHAKTEGEGEATKSEFERTKEKNTEVETDGEETDQRRDDGG